MRRGDEEIGRLGDGETWRWIAKLCLAFVVPALQEIPILAE